MIIMSSVILQAETLNLPEIFAFKLRGKKVELVESGDVIIINPIKSPIELACGILKSDGHEVDRFMERKQFEKELEYGG